MLASLAALGLRYVVVYSCFSFCRLDVINVSKHSSFFFFFSCLASYTRYIHSIDPRPCPLTGRLLSGDDQELAPILSAAAAEEEEDGVQTDSVAAGGGGGGATYLLTVQPATATAEGGGAGRAVSSILLGALRVHALARTRVETVRE